MNFTEMIARVEDQRLTLSNVPPLASGGANSLRIRVELCELWDGLGLTGVFYRSTAAVYHVPVSQGVVIVPHEVLVDGGRFWFGLFGTNGELIRTTEVVEVILRKGAITTATAQPGEPTPDVYSQILTAYGEMDAALAEAMHHIERLGDRTRDVYTVTLYPVWYDSDPYWVDVDIDGITEGDTPHITPVYSGTNAEKKAQKAAWGLVSEASTYDGGIYFECYDAKPAVPITIQVEVIR